MTKQEFLVFVDNIYQGARSVMHSIPRDKLNFRPRPDMMTIGQLIHHMGILCGGSIKHVFEGKFPPSDPSKPVDVWTAEKDLHECRTVQEGLDLLDRDEATLKVLLKEMDPNDFRSKTVQPPWSPKPLKIWHYCLLMADHLSCHRMQLYQYLKILGEPVNTATLYGLNPSNHLKKNPKD